METNTLAKMFPFLPISQPFIRTALSGTENMTLGPNVSVIWDWKHPDDRALAFHLHCVFPRNLPLNLSQARAIARGPELWLLWSSSARVGSFSQRTWKSLFHKTNSCDSFLVLMAVFRKTKEREQGGSSCLLSSYYVSSRCNERNRGARIPWNQY